MRNTMIRLKSILTEDKDPSDVVLGKWAMSAKLSDDTMQAKVDAIKDSPEYKEQGSVDYARVVYDLGRDALLKLYNEK